MLTDEDPQAWKTTGYGNDNLTRKFALGLFISMVHTNVGRVARTSVFEVILPVRY